MLTQLRQKPHPAAMSARCPHRHALRLSCGSFALLLVLAAAGTARAQELPLTHYTPEGERTPLPSAVVTGVYQDQMGFVWAPVFTSGLVRYDGHEMEVYTKADGLKDLSIWRVLEDPVGRLWVVSNAGLAVSEKPLARHAAGERVRFTSSFAGVELTAERLSSNAVDLADGYLLVGASGQRIIRYRVDSADAITVDTMHVSVVGTSAPFDIRSLAAGEDGSVWVGTGSGALLVRRSGASSFTERWAWSDTYVNVLYEGAGGSLWAGTRAGDVYRFDAAGQRAAPALFSSSLESNIVAMLAESESVLWVASEGSGVLRIDLRAGPGERLYARRNGLLSETVYGLMRDHEGNIWLAQTSGLSKLRQNYAAFDNFSSQSKSGERPALPSPSVGAVAAARYAQAPCQWWAGTSEGGVACIDEAGTSAVLDAAGGLLDNWVNALVLDERGRLWVGTAHGIQSVSFSAAPGTAAWRRVSLHGRTAHLSTYWSRPAITSVRALRTPGRSSESVWFTSTGALFALVGDTWLLLGPPAGIPDTRLQDVAYDDEGRLWVSTQNRGIYRSKRALSAQVLRELYAASAREVGDDATGARGRVIEGDLFEPVWSRALGSPTDEVYGLLHHGSQIWAATPEGIFILEGRGGGAARTAAHLTEESGLGANFTVSLALAPDGRTIWAGTNLGLAEIDAARRLVRRNLTKQDGLADNEVWYTGSVAVAPGGAVLFGTAKGMTVYRPALDARSVPPPKVVLRRADYREGAGYNEFTAEYAALSFADEKQVRYKTRLVGFDDEWSPEKADPRIRYTNLPAVFLPRTYTLEVLGRSPSGAWAPAPARFSFSVTPVPWLRWWAFLIYGLSVAGLALSVHRLQHNRLVRRERERAQILEAELKAEAAMARSEAAEARAQVLASDYERKELELAKARELEGAYSEINRKSVENERLLLNILPSPIAERLKRNEGTIADTYAEATVLFADLVGFTTFSTGVQASYLVQLLNALFSDFDRLVLTHGVEKIKTIGDSYMAAAGVPVPRHDHASVMVDVGIGMLEAVGRFNETQGTDFNLRVGISSGPVVAGVIGTHKFVYDLWGDTVNTAARMESHGLPGLVHLSGETRARLDGDYDVYERGVVQIKGKGSMQTFLLNPATRVVYSPHRSGAPA